MKIFISGGCKNGKSYYAQRLSKAQPGKLYYVATMLSADSEDDSRILNHQKEREGWGFETVEQYRDIHKILEFCNQQGSYLMDSVTALLSNEMFPKGEIYRDAYLKVGEDLKRLCDNVSNIVFVSDYIYSDAFVYDELTEEYRMGLGYLDRVLAERCDIVLESVYSNIIVHKGRDLFNEINEKII